MPLTTDHTVQLPQSGGKARTNRRRSLTVHWTKENQDWREESPQTNGDLRLWDFMLVQQRCQDCPLDDDQSKRPANSNSKPGEPGLARGKPASTNGDLRLGDFMLVQQRCQDCPLDDDQSKRPANSNSKPGEPGLARGKPANQRRPPTLGLFACATAIPGLPNSTPDNLRGLNKNN